MLATNCTFFRTLFHGAIALWQRHGFGGVLVLLLAMAGSAVACDGPAFTAVAPPSKDGSVGAGGGLHNSPVMCFCPLGVCPDAGDGEAQDATADGEAHDGVDAAAGAS